MNREKYKVLVSGKEEAEQFKQALLALGESVGNQYYNDPGVYPYTQDQLVFIQAEWVIASKHDDLTTITFKQLLFMLAGEVKPNLLDGKVAIQVNNEREFKLLMEHYESKGWNSSRSTSHYKPAIHRAIDYHDNYFWDEAEVQEERYGYKVIPFSDFAKEVGIKVPAKTKHKTEEGQDIYIGDTLYFAILDLYGWRKGNGRPFDDTKKWAFIDKPEVCKAFSTNEAAEKWVAEQNKPKEIHLHTKTDSPVKVTKNYIDFKLDGFKVLRATGKELEEIYTAYISLQ